MSDSIKETSVGFPEIKKPDSILKIDPAAEKLLEQWDCEISPGNIVVNANSEFKRIRIADISRKDFSQELSDYDFASVTKVGENKIEVERHNRTTNLTERIQYELKNGLVKEVEN